MTEKFRVVGWWWRDDNRVKVLDFMNFGLELSLDNFKFHEEIRS